MSNGIYARIDVTLPDDPKIIEAGPAAELVYLRVILRSRSFLTDGVMSRSVAPRWLAGCSRWALSCSRLVNVGLLEVCDEGWRIPPHVWSRWAPLATEVQAKRHADLERKRAWRAARDASATQLSQRDTNVARRVRDRNTETETETETYKTTPLPPAAPGDNNAAAKDACRAALDLYADAEVARSAPDNETAYRHTVTHRAKAEHGTRMIAYAADQLARGATPEALPGMIAREVLGMVGSTATVTVDDTPAGYRYGLARLQNEHADDHDPDALASELADAGRSETFIAGALEAYNAPGATIHELRTAR